MAAWISRNRYVLVAFAIGILTAALNLRIDAMHSVGGLSSAQSGPGTVLVRALKTLENRTIDTRFRLRGERAVPSSVVVVEVDQKSVGELGRWPWRRSRTAQLIDALVDGGVAAVGLDITFTERVDDGVGSDVGSSLADGGMLSPEDAALLGAFTRAGGRLTQGLFAYDEAARGDFPQRVISEQQAFLEAHGLRELKGPNFRATCDVDRASMQGFFQRGLETPMGPLAGLPNRFGHVDFSPDVDGVLRRSPIVMLVGPNPASVRRDPSGAGAESWGYVPSMALETTAAFLGATVEVACEPSTGALAGAWLRLPDHHDRLVPFQSEPFAPINYLGPGTAFHRVSAADVIANRLPPGTLDGKLVLVGITLVGASGDQRVTPFREIEPGVFTHAAMASNILDGRYLRRPPLSTQVESLLMLVLALGLGVWIPRIGSFAFKLLVMTAVIGSWLVVAQLAFNQDVLIAVVAPTINALGVSFGVVFLGYLSVDREKQALRSTFSKYLGEDVMEEALKFPEKLNRGEKREMTVLFSDIRGFTSLSERMAPEQLASFINGYLSPMTQIVFDERGTLDKYIGDALMAFWNAPLDQSDHALRACRAAVRMLKRLEELRGEWRAKGLPNFEIGVGINSGPMIVGNMGSDVRVDYTIMGDAVNLASRLEGTNKEYETNIIIGEGTWALVQGAVTARRLGAVRVKGKARPTHIYELRAIGVPGEQDARAIAAFEAAVDAYAARRWDEAIAGFAEVQSIWPGDAPSIRYVEEIEVFKDKPPPKDWDGVFTATTK